MTTEAALHCTDDYPVLFGVLYSVIGLVILAGNIFSIIVFLATANLRRQHMNIFLVSLAISDTMMAALVAPSFATFCAPHCGSTAATGPATQCWLMRAIKDVVLIASMFNLFAITYDRYVAVLRPLQYNAKLTQKRVTVLLAGVWFIPVVFAAVRNVWQHTTSDETQKKYNQLYNSIIIVTVVIIPICIMTLVNMRIVRAINAQWRRIRAAPTQSQRGLEPSSGPGSETTVKAGQRRNKGSLACVLIVFIFVICWLPRCIYIIYNVTELGGLADVLFFKLSFTFLFFQSSVNPIIYSFYRSDFRLAALRLLGCRRKSNRVPSPSGGAR